MYKPFKPAFFSGPSRSIDTTNLVPDTRRLIEIYHEFEEIKTRCLESKTDYLTQISRLQTTIKDYQVRSNHDPMSSHAINGCLQAIDKKKAMLLEIESQLEIIDKHLNIYKTFLPVNSDNLSPAA